MWIPKFMLVMFYSAMLSFIFSSGRIYIDCPKLMIITPSKTRMLAFSFNFDLEAEMGEEIDHFFTM